MSEQVRVDDIEVFRLFRAAMLKFAQATEQSLTNADSQISRTHSWLESEQSSYWKGQLRLRSENVTKARDALRQKKLFRDYSGRTPDTSEEEKMLARCLAAVEHAQDKIEAVRKWLPRLEKEADLYRGGVARLLGTAGVEVPRAVALLDRLAASLEAYVQLEGPGIDIPASAAPTDPTDTPTEPTSPTPPAAAAAAQTQTPPPDQAAEPRKET